MKLLEPGLALEVTDVSAQRRASVRDVPLDSTVGELLQGLLAQLHLPQSDVEGRPLSYGVRRDRDGLHLHASERVGEALLTGDRIVLQPSVDAG